VGRAEGRASGRGRGGVMAKWVHTLNIKDKWQACKDDRITVKDLTLGREKRMTANYERGETRCAKHFQE